MEVTIRKAEPEEAEIVKNITHETIMQIYPQYYPKGAVDHFLKGHSLDYIMEDIEFGKTYLCFDENGTPVGTVTVINTHITRLFVLPEHQGKGYGRALLNFAEDHIYIEFENIFIDASLPAKAIYLKRGYKEHKYNVVETDNGDFLCYDEMTKNFYEDIRIKNI